MEVYSEAASKITRFAQLIELIREHDEGKYTKNKENEKSVSKETLLISKKAISDLEKERLEVESSLIKSFRDIKLYFGSDASKRVDNIRTFYNTYGNSFDDKFIKIFLSKSYKLLNILESEIMRDLNTNN